MSEQLNRLRTALTQLHSELKAAEKELADRLRDIQAFETEFEAKVGPLANQLQTLEQEIQRYKDRIQLARNRQIFGNAHLSVEEQYRRVWQTSSPAGPEPTPQTIQSPDHETEIKRLYRQLARRFHPDLTTDEAERLRRTHKMAAINDAYEARSLVELIALAESAETMIDLSSLHPQQTEAQLVEVLKAELERCQGRLRHIRRELGRLSHRPSVELSLAIKAARRQGRDLLAEIIADFKQKIARQTVERDLLRVQIEQSGLDQGFIEINR